MYEPTRRLRELIFLSSLILADQSQGPQSHLYSHILTSCFLDTVLVPLCTWLYLLALLLLAVTNSRHLSVATRQAFQDVSAIDSGSRKKASGVAVDQSPEGNREFRSNKIQRALFVLYMLLLLAQLLMCVLEIARLSLAHLGIGLLPFTFVTLLVAGALRLSHKFRVRVRGWRWANLAVWIALAVTNSVKIAEEVKEGTGQRKGSKYPESDEVIDVSVMIGVYAALAILEILVEPWIPHGRIN